MEASRRRSGRGFASAERKGCASAERKDFASPKQKGPPVTGAGGLPGATARRLLAAVSAIRPHTGRGANTVSELFYQALGSLAGTI